MIENIKEESEKLQQAVQDERINDWSKYQQYGISKGLGKFFVNAENRHNCTSWCIEKLAMVGIGSDRTFKPKPGIVSCCAVYCKY